jgi:pSer/pThr/pTyr-binding forkhead associated (FHA) protein
MPRITITEPGKTPQPYRFDLATDLVRIGRRSENEMVVSCGSASGKHAEMVRVPGGFELYDLGSTNGIIKDGNRVRSLRLTDGEKLLLGDISFEFQLTEEEVAALAAEVAPSIEKENATPARSEDRPIRSQRTVAPAPSAGGGRKIWVAFIVLGAIAFYQGMSLREKNDAAALRNAMEQGSVASETAQPAASDDGGDVFHAADPADSGTTIMTPVEDEVPEELEGWESRAGGGAEGESGDE